MSIDDKQLGGQHSMPASGSGVRLGIGEVFTCHNFWCDYKTRENLDKCPECGRPLLRAETFRLLGWLLVFLGGILAAIGGGVILLINYSNRGIKGGMSGKMIVYGILGLVLAVGLTFMIAGLRQAIDGRRNRKIIYVALGLLLALLVIGEIVQLLA